MKNILDSDILDVNHSIMESVKWWESKRRWYNLILLVFGLGLMVSEFSAILFIGIPLTVTFIVIYGICANLFYSLGWGIEILLKYYFDFPSEKYPRPTLYVVGLVFSILFTGVIFFMVANVVGVIFD